MAGPTVSFPPGLSPDWLEQLRKKAEEFVEQEHRLADTVIAGKSPAAEQAVDFLVGVQRGLINAVLPTSTPAPSAPASGVPVTGEPAAVVPADPTQTSAAVNFEVQQQGYALQWAVKDTPYMKEHKDEFWKLYDQADAAERSGGFAARLAFWQQVCQDKGLYGLPNGPAAAGATPVAGGTPKLVTDPEVVDAQNALSEGALSDKIWGGENSLYSAFLSNKQDAFYFQSVSPSFEAAQERGGLAARWDLVSKAVAYPVTDEKSWNAFLAQYVPTVAK